MFQINRLLIDPKMLQILNLSNLVICLSEGEVSVSY